MRKSTQVKLLWNILFWTALAIGCAALIAISGCEPEYKMPLKAEFKYWALVNTDFDGSSDTTKIIQNKHYGNARRTIALDEPLDVVCFLEDTIYLTPGMTETFVFINNLYHDGQIFYDGEWQDPEFAGTEYTTWNIPVGVTGISTSTLNFQWIVNGPLDCDGLGLPIELKSFEYEKIGEDYLFHVVTASEIDVDRLTIIGSNDGKIWLPCVSVPAQNEKSGWSYEIWYIR